MFSSNKGLSLLEMIIAIALLTILGGTVTSYLFSNINLEAKGRVLTQLNQQASLAVSWLEQDIRTSLFITTASPAQIIINTNTGMVTYNYDQAHNLLTRMDTNGTETLLDNVSTLTFSYLDQNGPIAFNTSGQIDVTNLINIKVVGIALGMNTGGNVLNINDSVRYSPNSLPAWNPRLNNFYSTITAALSDHNLQDGDTIKVQGGTFSESTYQIRTGITLMGGYNKVWSARDQVTVLDGTTAGGKNAGYIINLQGGSNISIDGFTFTNAKMSIIGSGAVSNLTIQNDTFSNNQCAIVLENGGGTVQIINSKIISNMDAYVYSVLNFSSNFITIKIANCLITGNQFTGTGASIIGVMGNVQNFSIINSSISSNTNSGTIEPSQSIISVGSVGQVQANVLIKNSQINNNTLSIGMTYSGIVFLNTTGSVDFENCDISGNTISQGATYVGIIYASQAGAFTMTHCNVNTNVFKNMTIYNGIIYVYQLQSTFTIDRCVLENNTTTGSSIFSSVLYNGLIGIRQFPNDTSLKHIIENTIIAGDTFDFSVAHNRQSNGLINFANTGSNYYNFYFINDTIASNTVNDADLFYLEDQSSVRFINDIHYFNYAVGQTSLSSNYYDFDGSDSINMSYWDIESITNNGLNQTSTSSNFRIDPKFVNSANYDFHLNLTSSCIAQGRNPNDGSPIDLGAYGGAADVGFTIPNVDDQSTTDIKEDVIGTHSWPWP